MKRVTIHLSVFIIYLLVYLAANVLLLGIFPAMHTDEAWLAGLSRTMMAGGDFSATESFFDLLPRAAHSLRILYHLLQIQSFRLFGFGLFAGRLPSLAAGIAVLAVFYALLRRLGLPALTGSVLLSLDIQFIYASHFGRQEIFILLFMLMSVCLMMLELKHGGLRGFLSALPLAAACGFHPNAFIAAWPSALLLLILIIRRRRRPAEGAVFLLTAAGGAAFFAGLSYVMNRRFPAEYAANGRAIGAMRSFDLKLLGFDDFYRKLFARVSGTYYTPEIRPLFLLAAASVLLVLLLLIAGRLKKGSGGLLSKAGRKTAIRGLSAALLSIAAVNAAIIIIGKYIPPSIVLLSPFLIIPAVCAAELLRRPLRSVFTAAAAVLLLANSAIMIVDQAGAGSESFSSFSSRLRLCIEDGKRALGGLEAVFSLDEGMLLDWRNLAHLDEAGLSFADYIESRNIEYIIYSDEIDYIYENRPVWNLLYGNPARYYVEMKEFIDGSCILSSSFDSPRYGTRIMPLRYGGNWTIRIYRVSAGSGTPAGSAETPSTGGDSSIE